MATKQMLIDATHPEETRVVVIQGTRLEDFDVEVESRKHLKGNIYLAKVIRVEPSLQAAFVDFGGNRHGFLSFNEIHPDYYQIPVADREVLLAEHEADETENDAADADETEGASGVETVGGDDDEEVEARRPVLSHRHYKIQEVIKRRQILLVQVVKEERGNKGAALTTYISLAGRYCVLMPNTARGGGISRKISNSADRKRLKSILGDLGIPKGMAVIVRTAGSKRTKAEMKRDSEYLLRLWDKIRKVTLESTAPTLVHEEGNLIKRTIRDLYRNDIEEIIVDGDEGYRMAKDFMKLLIPSHAKRVKHYTDSGIPLMHRYQIEGQLDAMHGHEVQLRSGGYIVISPTEALVAIDVNSGRATRERNIEETALRTNLEAAEEVARQLRLRDLAGLIVIDFIDMESQRNQTQVERRLKDSMQGDRARIQLGRISPFGLLELSRQRLRPSLIETSFEPCVHCGGTGVRRSIESAALVVLRAIEEESHRRRPGGLTVHLPTEVALYILNQKRATLGDIETRNNLTVLLSADDSLIPPDHRIDYAAAAKGTAEPAAAEDGARTEVAGAAQAEEEDGKRRRRRRPRRRKRSDEDRQATQPEATADAPDEAVPEAAGVAEDATPETAADGSEEPTAKRRRRGRRGGRRRSRKTAEQRAAEDRQAEAQESGDQADVAEVIEIPITVAPVEEPAPAGDDQPPSESEAPVEAAEAADEVAPEKKKPAAKRATKGRRTKNTATTRSRAKKAANDGKTAADDDGKTAAKGTRKSTGAKDAKEAKKKPATRRRRTAKTAEKKSEPAKEPETAEAPPEIVMPSDFDLPVPQETPAATAVGDTASKTVVIDISSQEPGDETRRARTGWWQRLTK